MITLALLILLVPVLTLAIVLKLDLPDPNTLVVDHGPTGVAWVDAWLIRVKLWHVLVSITLTALIFASVLATHRIGVEDAGFAFVLTSLLLLGLFLRAWRHEFVILMAQPDNVFPGRHDKLIWVLMFLILPPLAVGSFRAYRGVSVKSAETRAAGRARPSTAHESI